MPTRPASPCTVPTCAQVATTRGRCATHAGQADRARGTAQQRGYTHTWAAYSVAWRARFPLCGMRGDGRIHEAQSRCAQQGLEVPAQCVDHIIPVSKGGSMWDPNNHQSLCIPCNTAKGNR